MMDQRKIAMWAALAAVLLLAAWMWAVSPLLAYRAKLAADIQSGGRALQTLASLAADHKALVDRVGQRRAKPRQATLFALLEETAAKENVRANIEFMRPTARQGEGGRKDELVEMRLTGVPLTRLTAFVGSVENAAPNLRVERLNIKTNPNKPLDVDVLFSAPREETAQAQ